MTGDVKRTCRTCVWLTVPPDKAGRRAARKDNVYPCAAPLPDVALPRSVTERFGFNWPPRRTMMSPDRGEDCPAWHGSGRE